MYTWVVPPEILGRLWAIREQTKIPIARQIREAVQAYLSQAEARPEAAASETSQPQKGGKSSCQASTIAS